MSTSQQSKERKYTMKTIQEILDKRNYKYVKVGWDDCSRAYGSSVGSNISDWTFKMKNGEILPFIRCPNYEDKTITLSAKDIAIVIGNDNVDKKLKTVSFQDYMENYGKYTPGVPNNINLSSSEDELVTVRYIAVICPEDEHGTCELVPTAYNYQTCDKKDPKNFIGASFHMGVGSRTDGPNCESVYLVKHKDGYQENTWFRLTNSNKETDEQKKAVSSVLGTRSTGIGRNRVQCFQIPRKQVNKVQMRGGDNKKKSLFRSLSVNTYQKKGISKANVSYGSSAGKHTMVDGISYERDKTQNVTITFAYYYSTPLGGEFDESEIGEIMDTLDKSYLDTKTKWKGSLVTGEGDDKFKSIKPSIILPEMTQEDYLTFNQKVTCFPKDIGDLQIFP